jgi:hypothetical protein
VGLQPGPPLATGTRGIVICDPSTAKTVTLGVATGVEAAGGPLHTRCGLWLSPFGSGLCTPLRRLLCNCSGQEVGKVA